jgi:STELLO glycosyltransferases
VTARTVKEAPWVNAYRFFTEEQIWPRGFPLRLVWDDGSLGIEACGEISTVVAPIQQGLVDLSPDVDAVWRLVLDQEFRFRKANSILLPPGSWCPFNSQSTWWHPPALPLLYLPSHCSFRMTDIWRSFIAQRCLWELGTGVVFHSSEVEQGRNLHDLMTDFRDEVPGYLRNEELVRILELIRLEPGLGAVGANMLRCYEELQGTDFFAGDEIPLVKAWLGDVEEIISVVSHPQEVHDLHR